MLGQTKLYEKATKNRVRENAYRNGLIIVTASSMNSASTQVDYDIAIDRAI